MCSLHRFCHVPIYSRTWCSNSFYCLLQDPRLDVTHPIVHPTASTAEAPFVAFTQERLEARLLLYRGCVKRCTFLRAGVVLGTASKIQQQSEKQNKNDILGVSMALLGSADRKAIPWLLARSSDFEGTPRARATEPGRGQNVRLLMVYTRPPCVPRS